MKDFCIYQHAQLPITRVAVGKVPSEWNLRYKLEIDCDHEPVVKLLDESMGDKTRGGGMYASKAEEVIEKFQRILDEAPPPEEEKQSVWRIPTTILGWSIFVAWIAIRIMLIPVAIVFIMFSSHSGMTTAGILLIDWACRPTRLVKWLLAVK